MPFAVMHTKIKADDEAIYHGIVLRKTHSITWRRSSPGRSGQVRTCPGLHEDSRTVNSGTVEWGRIW